MTEHQQRDEVLRGELTCLWRKCRTYMRLSWERLSLKHADVKMQRDKNKKETFAIG